MFNFGKKKNLSIEFLTEPKYTFAHEFFPVQRSSRFIPNWFKNTPKSSVVTNLDINTQPEFVTNTTARGCIGIQNAITAGVVIPWWTDLQISVFENGCRYMFTDEQSVITHHHSSQSPGFLEDYYILKIHNPWIMRTSSPLKFMVTPYFYADPQSDVISIPGIGETYAKNNISSLHFFLAFKKTNKFTTYTFKNNRPAIQIIPLTENDYSLSNSIVSTEDYTKLTSVLTSRITGANSGLLKRKLSKCPFHNKE